MFVYIPYDRRRAVEYARRWALSRNPLFTDFSAVGGDCTGFVSQAVLAGGCVMDTTPTFGWYYRSEADRAPAWSGVEFFYDYMTGVGNFPPADSRSGPYGRDVLLRDASIGDVIQLADAEVTFYHTLIVTGFSGGDTLVAAHTVDSLDRPLSTYSYESLRVIKIEGFRLYLPDGDCYENLIEGRSLEGVRFG